MMRRFQVTTRDLPEGTRDVRIDGELDLAVVDRLDEALAAAAGECGQVLVGLEGCDFIDSSGIAVILRARNRMEEEGKRLVVYAPSAQVLRVLAMTGLTSNGLVFGSAAEALSALDGSEPSSA
jgi:anti-sigma B factor antagonist